MTASHNIYNFCHLCGHDHVLLTEAEACQAEGGAAFFEHLRMHIVDNAGMFDR